MNSYGTVSPIFCGKASSDVYLSGAKRLASATLPFRNNKLDSIVNAMRANAKKVQEAMDLIQKERTQEFMKAHQKDKAG